MLFIKKTSIILIILSFLLLSGVNAQNNDNMIKLKVNDHIFDVELENNSAAQELIKELEKIKDKSANIIVYDQCGGYITFDEVIYSEDDNTVSFE